MSVAPSRADFDQLVAGLEALRLRVVSLEKEVEELKSDALGRWLSFAYLYHCDLQSIGDFAVALAAINALGRWLSFACLCLCGLQSIYGFVIGYRDWYLAAIVLLYISLPLIIIKETLL